MFLSPSPLSLLCAFILCFPLAFFLTVKTTLPAGIRNYHPSRNGRQPSLLLPSSPPAGRRQPLHQLPPFIDGSKKTGNLPVRVRERRKPAGRPRKLAFMFLTTTPAAVCAAVGALLPRRAGGSVQRVRPRGPDVQLHHAVHRRFLRPGHPVLEAHSPAHAHARCGGASASRGGAGA
ncbi:unnamed protein product [Cuscuta epithymum]|uniref:Uncharacterized protein n=1 Tax=Cuscuta epithymum TaxID=186058 RepID=A0AAV0GEB7_9ASTE|nr:unnamed protein product [Cuscuta epithymum]